MAGHWEYCFQNIKENPVTPSQQKDQLPVFETADLYPTNSEYWGKLDTKTMENTNDLPNQKTTHWKPHHAFLYLSK